MAFVDLQMPPGMSRNGTPRQNRGRWYDGSLVRWVQGRMQPVGGWEKASDVAADGRICGLHAWWGNSEFAYIAQGTTRSLSILSGGTTRNITPTDLIVGRDMASQGSGFGVGPYDREEYGTERSEASASIVLEAMSWSMDSFGTFLVACSSADGRVLYWDPAPGAMDKAEPVANAPVRCRAVLTTDERHLMVVGPEGARDRIAWSDREAFDDWTYDDQTSLAGFLTVKTDGTLRTALRVGASILLLSDVDAFQVNYLGSTLVYGAQRVGTACGVISARAVVATNDFAVWMGKNGFFIYQGYVKPLSCDVWDWIYRDLNDVQRTQIVAGHNTEFSEVWWFFPSEGSPINNRYVAWNYRENHWTLGYLGRDAWLDNGVVKYPLASGTDRMLYQHEDGYLAAGKARIGDVWARSAPMEMSEGDRTLAVTSLIPDRDSTGTHRLEYRFFTRFTPTSTERTYGPYRADVDGYTDTRFTGRQAEMRVDIREDGDWRLGSLRMDAKVAGKR